jgi:hypothetical protein
LHGISQTHVQDEKPCKYEATWSEQLVQRYVREIGMVLAKEWGGMNDSVLQKIIVPTETSFRMQNKRRKRSENGSADYVG